MSATIPTPADLLVEMVRIPSVTPQATAALDLVERELAAGGFAIERPVFSAEGTYPVENLFAAIGSGERHLTLSGHVDVVPPGAEASWTHPPFAAEIVNGVLYGRGAVDMKGGLVAMIVAARRFLERKGGDFGGRLSFLVTGDEEAASINGTEKLVEWAARRGERFSAAIVGEPTSARELGDLIKIGRRGSFTATLVVEGKQGHAAYPELADNPVRGLTQLLYALQETPLDSGTEHFGPSSLEVVSVDIGNPAWNVIPAKVTVRLSSRYNDLWTRAKLQAEIERRFTAAAASDALAPKLPIRWSLRQEPQTGDVFLTRDENLIEVVSSAIEKVCGRRPELSTSGGTSDARFIKDYCPVVEFGLVGTTIHQVDERVPLAEIERVALIYEEMLSAYFR